MKQDICWRRRFNNYLKALQSLDEAHALIQTRALSKLEQQGLIQSFEFTHELAWNVFKDYLTDQGIAGLIGSRDATPSAFKNGLTTEGEDWMRMIADRNLTFHTYDQATAQAIVDNILARYYPAFKVMAATFMGRYQQADTGL